MKHTNYWLAVSFKERVKFSTQFECVYIGTYVFVFDIDEKNKSSHRLTPEMFVICLPIELHYSAGKMTASLFCVVCSHLNHSPTGHFTVFGASNSVDQRD